MEARLISWMAPDRVRRAVAREEESWSGSAGNMRKDVSDRMELVSFSQS